MTLNLTVATSSCIYQSADYRLTDWHTGRPYDFTSQKIVLVNRWKWSATVCFAGVGRSQTLDVSQWLAERVDTISSDDPFERLIDELLTANKWLSSVPVSRRRHSFSIGAFVGDEPLFVLISNFEPLYGDLMQEPSAELFVSRMRPKKPSTFVSGRRQAVKGSERRELAKLAANDSEVKDVFAALAAVNQKAADRDDTISRSCFTGYVRFTGEGGGFAHDIGERPFVPSFAFPGAMRDAMRQLLDKQFGPGRAQLRQMAFARAEASDEYHNAQLRDKPDDPSAHSNYGAFLQDKKRDLQGAEREYRKAIELDHNHVNALGNLANIFWETGRKEEAVEYYERALTAGPGDENVTWNYARFLLTEPNGRSTARKILDCAIEKNPESGRLLVLRAQIKLEDGAASEALEDFQKARGKNVEQSDVEVGHAIGLHISGAPIGDCIAAYRVAITLAPTLGELRLNLAQLLFLKGENVDAHKQLHEAMTLGLSESAQLEVQFYLLSHTSSDRAAIIQAIRTLLTRGARLRWNIKPNIEFVNSFDSKKASFLKLVSEIMAGERDEKLLESALSKQ